MKQTMRAAVFEGEGRLVLRTMPAPEIRRAADVLIRVEACSVCGTDVHILSVPPGYTARPGTVLGHELVGEVVAVGEEVASLRPGDRVVCNPNEPCGVCGFCRKNLPNLCEHIIPLGIEADGGFAEYVCLAEACAYKIPDRLPAETAMFAEPLACVLSGVKKLAAAPGESVLILGAGPIGLMMVQMMKASGARPIIVSETSPTRRQFALDSGADMVVDPAHDDLEAAVGAQTGAGADHVIDMTGSLLRTAIQLVRKGGKVLLFGVNTGSTAEVKQSDITQKEITILGTWLANASFAQAVKLLESGILPLEKLITHRCTLETLEPAIELLRKGRAVKILVDCQKRGEDQ